MNWHSSVCLLTSIYSLTHALHPIVIVSGIFCNGLVADIDDNADIDPKCKPKDGGPFRLYVEPSYLAEYGSQCFNDGLELYYDPKTHTTRNRRGVDVRSFMDLSFVETLDEAKNLLMLKTMVDFLEVKLRYIRNVSIFGASYDFRKGPSEPEMQAFCIEFKQMIINAFTVNKGKKVILLYYSMGSSMTLFCLRGYSQEFKDRYILIIISMAGVYGGTAKIIDILGGVRFYGTEFQPAPANYFSDKRLMNSINTTFVKDAMGLTPSVTTSIEVIPGSTVRNFTSIPWIAPTEAGFGNQVIAQTQSKTYTARNLREYYEDMGGKDFAQIFDDASNYTTLEAPKGIKMYCLYGYNIPTLLTINHAGDSPNSPKSYPTNGDGDGLVSIQGLNCELLKREPDEEPMVIMPFANHDHLSFLSSSDVFERITDIVTRRI